VSAEAIRTGADAALLDGATWAKQGRNTVLFGVTQGSGGHGFGVQARVVGEARVRAVAP